MSRQDHTFIFSGGQGAYGLAFCPASEGSAAETRELVETVLVGAVPGARLAYLGLLDYGAMDEWAGEMTGPFEKHGKVWLARFAETGR